MHNILIGYKVSQVKDVRYREYQVYCQLDASKFAQLDDNERE